MTFRFAIMVNKNFYKGSNKGDKMGNQNLKWKEQTQLQKGITVIIIVIAVAVIVLSSLGIFDVLEIDWTNRIVIPLVGFSNILNGIKFFKENRASAIFFFILGAVIFVFYILTWIGR